MSNFLPSISLNTKVRNVLSEEGFNHETSVQRYSIPVLLEGKDACVEASTGSGKTLCYVIAILEKIIPIELSSEKGKIVSIVIVPTRIIAKQVNEVITPFLAKFSGEISSFLAVGGASKTKDISTKCQQFLRANKSKVVVIATPGCIVQFIKSSISMSEVRVVILDEADRLLDTGFFDSIRFVLDELPKQRLTGLFSATMTTSVKELAMIGLKNFAEIRISSDGKLQPLTTTSTSQSKVGLPSSSPFTSVIPKGLTNYYRICQPNDKFAFLCRFLRWQGTKPGSKVIIFFLTRHMVDHFYRILTEVLTSFEDHRNKTKNPPFIVPKEDQTEKSEEEDAENQEEKEASGDKGKKYKKREGKKNKNMKQERRKQIVTNEFFPSTCFAAIHGGTSSSTQQSVIKRFNSHGLESSSSSSSASASSTSIHSPNCFVLLTTDVVARGVDFESADWIVQFDPPQNPDTFVHRIGRSGRMGKKGSSLVLLLPKEDPYVYFLQGRKMKLHQWDENEMKQEDKEAKTIENDLQNEKASIKKVKGEELNEKMKTDNKKTDESAQNATQQKESSQQSHYLEALAIPVSSPYISNDLRINIDSVVELPAPFNKLMNNSSQKDSSSSQPASSERTPSEVIDSFFSTPSAVTAFLRREFLCDRSLFDSSQRAFVSFVRAYHEHHCYQIFSLRLLPWLDVLEMMALLEIPRMPELAKVAIGKFHPVPSDFKMKWIPYANKTEELQRLTDLAKHKFDRPITKISKKELSASEKKMLSKKRVVSGHIFNLQDELEIEKDYKMLKKKNRRKKKQKEGRFESELKRRMVDDSSDIPSDWPSSLEFSDSDESSDDDSSNGSPNSSESESSSIHSSQVSSESFDWNDKSKRDSESESDVDDDSDDFTDDSDQISEEEEEEESSQESNDEEEEDESKSNSEQHSDEKGTPEMDFKKPKLTKAEIRLRKEKRKKIKRLNSMKKKEKLHNKRWSQMRRIMFDPVTHKRIK